MRLRPRRPSRTSPQTNYYYKFIEGAKAAGMIQGVTATTFDPNANITRQEAVTILARYIAKVNGDNLDTMYTAAQVTAILAHFSDAATISPDMKNAIAFAFAMGITDGNDQVGTFSPNALLTRIQAAALIIRCEALNAIAPHGVPAHITLVGTDKNEYLIGQPHTVTFNVTDMNNHPVAGALVNFDSIWAQEFYVGNITSARGVLTDAFGNATVNIVATEPGTQRLSANVGTLAAVYTTDYWLALDDVYTVAANDGTRYLHASGAEQRRYHAYLDRPCRCGRPRTAVHERARLVQRDLHRSVRSDQHQDPMTASWCAVTGTMRQKLARSCTGYAPRTLAGITVNWSIVNLVDAVPAIPAVPAGPVSAQIPAR